MAKNAFPDPLTLIEFKKLANWKILALKTCWVKQKIILEAHRKKRKETKWAFPFLNQKIVCTLSISTETMASSLEEQCSINSFTRQKQARILNITSIDCPLATISKEPRLSKSAQLFATSKITKRPTTIESETNSSTTFKKTVINSMMILPSQWKFANLICLSKSRCVQ